MKDGRRVKRGDKKILPPVEFTDAGNDILEDWKGFAELRKQKGVSETEQKPTPAED